VVDREDISENSVFAEFVLEQELILVSYLVLLNPVGKIVI
jgi:hypothetical protein